MSENKYFKSSDLSLIAMLQVFGYQIEKIERNNSEKVIFAIQQDDKLSELVQAFWSRSLKVEPLQYFESLKVVKSRIYQI